MFGMLSANESGAAPPGISRERPGGATMNERQRSLDLALTQIEKQFGKGSIMKLGEHQAKLQVDVIPTGAIQLDVALGVGGVPRGRVVEIYGPESSGKTTLGYHIIAEAQREGGVAAFIDAEHALNPEYARNVGVDIDNLLISQPDSGEQALEIAEMLVRSGAVDIIVVDSVAALVPRAELEGEMGDAHVGLQARLMSQALRKLVGAISKSGSLLDLAVAQNLVTRTGTWFAYKEMRLGQGRDNARDFLETNPELGREIEATLREKLGISRPAARADSGSREAPADKTDK